MELDGIDDVFAEGLRINFYRIRAGILSNILKHSQATEASVVVKRTADEVLLTIRDNGAGFTPGAPRAESKRGGMGMGGDGGTGPAAGRRTDSAGRGRARDGGIGEDPHGEGTR